MDQSVAIELWALSTGLGQLVLLEVAPDDLRGGHVAHTTPHVAMMLLAAILSDTVILSSPTTTERDRVMVR
jgi:inorganic pyrophosphatase/exopolyphosphatase